MLSSDMIEAIQGVVDTYAVEERKRLESANKAFWETLRIHDPARYEAKQRGVWLVKEYNHEIGCTDVKYSYSDDDSSKYWLIKWIQLRLKDIPVNMQNDMYYRMFDASGKELSVFINWVPEIEVV